MKRELEGLLDEEHFFGNFRSYYGFHPMDTRLNLLPPGIFKAMWLAHGSHDSFSILDLGCNEGDLSYNMYLRAKQEIPDQVRIQLFGIDIDPILIEKAQSKYAEDGCCKFMVCDVLSQDFDSVLNRLMEENRIETFSLISLFSITMWLHINCGDSAFYDFLKKCCGLSHHVLIEPQPWRCYRQAKKRCLKNGIPLPEYLKDSRRLEPTRIEEDIAKYISESGLKCKEHWCLGREDWGRLLMLFHPALPPSLIEYRDNNIGIVSASKTENNNPSPS